MSMILKIKRGKKLNLPKLADGELGFCTDTGELFIGYGGNNQKPNRPILHTPTGENDTGTAGDVCYDATYVYFCVADNTWKRVAFTAW